jgi:protoporphyrinogen oxidase
MNDYTALTGGLATLPECLASQCEVRLNTPVTHLAVSPKGVQIDAGETKIIADRVILATPTTTLLFSFPARRVRR